MEISIFIAILLLHWVADFLLQTDQQAVNKSKSMYHLLDHTLTYSLLWFWAVLIFTTILEHRTQDVITLAVKFSAITFVAHTITDYFTSRLNAKLWAKKDMHYFFVSVGFDQVLHYVQLILTVKYLLF